MSDQDSPAVFETIVRIIHQQSADGALRSEIEAQLPSDDDRNELPRRLTSLERFGWITRTGRGQSTRYFVTPMALASLTRNDPPAASPKAALPSTGGAATEAAASVPLASAERPGTAPRATAKSPGESAPAAALPAARPAGDPTPPAPVSTAGLPGVTPASPTTHPAEPVAAAPLSPAAPPAGATPTAPAPAPARADFDRVTREAVGFIVGVAGLPASQARGMIQRYANANDLSEADAITFEGQVMSVLESLTEEEALTKYRIDAARYATWRDHCGWADGTHPKPASAGPTAGGPAERTEGANPAADATPKPYPERTRDTALPSTQPGAERYVERGTRGAKEMTKRTPTRAPDGRSEEHGGAQPTTRGEAKADTSGRSEGTAGEDEGAAAQGPLARLSPPAIALIFALTVVLGVVGAHWGGSAAGVVSAMLVPLGGLAAIWPRVRRATAAAAAATNGRQAATRASGGPLDILRAIPPRTLYALVGGVLAALTLIVGVTWWLQARTLPSKDEVSAFLVKSVAPLPVRVATLAVTPGADSAMGRTLSYQVRLETTEPLYDRVDTTKYLREHAAADLAVIDNAEALLKGANGERLRALMAGDAASIGDAKRTAGSGDARPTSSNPTGSAHSTGSGSSSDPALHPVREVVLVATATARGATAVTSGQLVAWKRDGVWAFNGDPVRLDRLSFRGEPMPAGAYAVDSPADEARLKAALAEQVGFAARVQAAATELAVETERARQQRIARFGELLRTGTVFTGTASGVTNAAATRVAVEIASSSATPSRLTALLRNDGGWADARLFQGEWSVSADAETCTVQLRTTRDDRIAGAGPLLDDAREMAVTLQLREEGAEKASGVSYVKPRDGDAAVRSAGPGLSASATLEGGAGADHWQLRRVEPVEVAALRAGWARSLAPALAATKPGLLYRGTVTAHGRNTPEVLMLRFTAQDANGVRLEASLQSATVANWVRAFRGAVIDNTYRVGSNPIRLRSPDADRIAQAPTWSMLGLATASDGVGLNLRVEPSAPPTGDSSAVPSAVGSAKAEGQAKADGTARINAPRLVGQDDRFTYVFEPADPAWTPPPAAATGSAVAGAAGSVLAGMTRALPPFPGEVGAYVLSDDGKWVPLPRNNSHVVQSTVQKANAFMSWLTQAEAKITGTETPDTKTVTAQWMFDGTTEVPVVTGEDVVVIYAGSLVMSQAMLAKYPQLALEPMMEMAPLWTLDSGVRSVPLTSPVKGVFGFGPLRVPATIERPALSITMLHVTTKLPPRRYAIGAGDNGYEVEVR